MISVSHLLGETHDENLEADQYHRFDHLAGGLDHRNRILRVLKYQNHQLGSHVSLHYPSQLAPFNLTRFKSWTCNYQDLAYNCRNIDFSVVCSKMVSTHQAEFGSVLT